MKNILSYFENFVFRYINLWDRATRAEYWVVMPVVWILIILAFVFDVREFWAFLLAREVPPLNPLYYESIVLFALTAIPRFSLTVRRLHDSGRSGKWATLPVTAIFSGLMLMVGLGSAIMGSNLSSMNGGQAEALAVGGIIAAAVVGQMETVWPALFALAATLNAIGWDVIWQVIAELLSNTKKPEVGLAMEGVKQGLQNDPLEGGALMLTMIGTVATPFVAAFMHLFFMLLPSDRDHNSYGESSVKPVTGFRQKGVTSDNPLAGYACLFEKTPEQETALREKQKQELKELYRSRVLGQPDEAT